MKIHLNETEIHKGIKMYIEHRGFSLKNQKVTIDMTQGRNPMRIYADIEIADHDTEVPEISEAPVEGTEDENSAGKDLNTNLFGEDD